MQIGKGSTQSSCHHVLMSSCHHVIMSSCTHHHARDGNVLSSVVECGRGVDMLSKADVAPDFTLGGLGDAGLCVYSVLSRCERNSVSCSPQWRN